MSQRCTPTPRRHKHVYRRYPEMARHGWEVSDGEHPDPLSQVHLSPHKRGKIWPDSHADDTFSLTSCSVAINRSSLTPSRKPKSSTIWKNKPPKSNKTISNQAEKVMCKNLGLKGVFFEISGNVWGACFCFRKYWELKFSTIANESFSLLF